MKKTLAFVMCMVVIMMISNTDAFASSTMKYFICAPLSVPDEGRASSITSMFSSSSYSASKTYYPYALTVYNAIKINAVTFVHGHGNTSYIAMQTSAGNTFDYLYANSSTGVSLSNYSLGELSSNKLVVFVACNSNFHAQMVYLRGGQYSVGFTVSVANGEDYMWYAVSDMLLGYSIETALVNASYAYHEDYGCSGTNCPAHGNHRAQFGSDHYL